MTQEPPPAESGGENIAIAASERYVWYGSRERLIRTRFHCEPGDPLTCVLPWRFGNTTEPELTAPEERGESNVVDEFSYAEYLFRRRGQWEGYWGGQNEILELLLRTKNSNMRRRPCSSAHGTPQNCPGSGATTVQSVASQPHPECHGSLKRAGVLPSRGMSVPLGT